MQHDEFAAPGVFLALRRTSVKSAGLTERATCKLCDKNMTLRALQKHLGHHQEQLSLFALPTNLDEMEDDPDEEAEDLPSMIGAISEEIDEEVTDTSDESEAEEMVVTTSQRNRYNISAQGDGAIETQVTADSGFNIQLPSFQGEGTGAIAQTENPAAAFEEFRGTAAPRKQDDERLYTGSSHTDFRPTDLPPRESLRKDASLEPAAVYRDETSPLDKAPSPKEDDHWGLPMFAKKDKKKKRSSKKTSPASELVVESELDPFKELQPELMPDVSAVGPFAGLSKSQKKKLRTGMENEAIAKEIEKDKSSNRFGGEEGELEYNSDGPIDQGSAESRGRQKGKVRRSSNLCFDY